MRLPLDLKSVDTHLNVFSQYNTTQHDNIDDEEKEHVHRHKHGKNEKEHEHGHDHTKVSQSEIKVLNISYRLVIPSITMKSKSIYYQKVMISNPHPFGIFRPPIS